MFRVFVFPAVGLFFAGLFIRLFKASTRTTQRTQYTKSGQRRQTSNVVCRSVRMKWELVFAGVVLHSPPESDERPANRKDNQEYKSKHHITFTKAATHSSRVALMKSSSSNGSMFLPSNLQVICRCSPVLRPVEPVMPTAVPAFTNAPLVAMVRERWQ